MDRCIENFMKGNQKEKGGDGKAHDSWPVTSLHPWVSWVLGKGIVFRGRGEIEVADGWQH